MCKYWLIVVVIFSYAIANAQLPVNLASVPEEMKKEASVIVHNHDISLTVEALDKVRMKVHKVYTVLNEKGKTALWFHEQTTRFVSLEDAEIKLYDQQGRQVEKYKKKDMMTQAIGEGLVEDGAVTFLRLQPPGYPVTVELSYEMEFEGTLFLPEYYFADKSSSVLRSSYTAKVPASLPLRYKARHCSLEPVISSDEKYRIYKWSVSNIPATANKKLPRNKIPSVKLVVDQFSHYDHQGDLSSWQSFGTWLRNLYAGLDELPAERQQFFRQLVADASDDREKVRRIYRYLQENFRYVSIQLGIGGLKPFPATFTDTKKYGDCKGLSNYMKAALKAVGIRSHVAIINSGVYDEPVETGFPENRFNHVILCVPAKDSIWLECTSSTSEFNSLGPSTENRNALLITEEGGVLVPTPKSNASFNVIQSTTTVNILPDMSAETETVFRTRGVFAEIFTDIVKGSRDEQKKDLVSYFGFKLPDDFLIKETRTESGVQTQVKTALRKLHEFNAGSKYFFNPHIQKLWLSDLQMPAEHADDFYFPFPFTKSDTTVLKFPEAFSTEVLPSEKKVDNEYLTYQSKTWFEEKEKALYSVTSFVLKTRRIPAASYLMAKACFDEVDQNETQKVVMRKGETPATEKPGF